MDPANTHRVDAYAFPATNFALEHGRSSARAIGELEPLQPRASRPLALQLHLDVGSARGLALRLDAAPPRRLLRWHARARARRLLLGAVSSCAGRRMRRLWSRLCGCRRTGWPGCGLGLGQRAWRPACSLARPARRCGRALVLALLAGGGLLLLGAHRRRVVHGGQLAQAPPSGRSGRLRWEVEGGRDMRVTRRAGTRRRAAAIPSIPSLDRTATAYCVHACVHVWSCY